jgi:hypothetical protein
MTEKTFLIRISDTHPESVGLSELAEILSGFDKAIRSMVVDQNSPLTLGLVSITPGSTILEVVSDRPVEARCAVSDLAKAVNDRNPGSLPAAARNGLQQVMPILRRWATEDRRPSFQLLLPDRDISAPLAVITPDMEFSFTPPKVLGNTTIYGSLIWIGGQRPKAHVKMDNGALLNCEVSKQLARSLASRLYEEIGLEGEAEWNSEDWSIVSFRISGVTDFRGGPIIESIDVLASTIAGDWDDADDVVGEISQIRREN